MELFLLNLYCCKKNQKSTNLSILQSFTNVQMQQYCCLFTKYLQYNPCKSFAASTLQKENKKPCKIFAAFTLQEKKINFKMVAASILQNVCSIHPANILLLKTCNNISAFNPSNILVTIIGQNYYYNSATYIQAAMGL